MAAHSQSRHGQFLALYRSSAQEQMANVTPGQAQAGMEAGSDEEQFVLNAKSP